MVASTLRWPTKSYMCTSSKGYCRLHAATADTTSIYSLNSPYGNMYYHPAHWQLHCNWSLYVQTWHLLTTHEANFLRIQLSQIKVASSFQSTVKVHGLPKFSKVKSLGIPHMYKWLCMCCEQSVMLNLLCCGWLSWYWNPLLTIVKAYTTTVTIGTKVLNLWSPLQMGLRVWVGWLYKYIAWVDTATMQLSLWCSYSHSSPS